MKNNEVLISDFEKQIIEQISKANDMIVKFAKEQFKKSEGFKKTKREGKDISLKTDLEHKIKNDGNLIEFSIVGNKIDISLLKEDEIGVGSKSIPTKANILKLKNDIRFYAKGLGGTELR